MTNVPDRFRLATLSMAMILGWFAAATMLAESLTPKPPPISQILAAAEAAPSQPPAEWAAKTAPLRGDLLADLAAARGAPALAPSKPPESDPAAARQQVLADARQSLSLAPHLSSTWLLVAMLAEQSPSQNAADSTTEVLKMSYLTSPTEVSLIPARLAIVAASAAIADAELKSLARSDIRLILTRRPDLKPAIADAYRRGSAAGKAYIEEVVRALDPGFAASLR